MKEPKDITSIEDLVGYTILASDIFGPIVVWDGKDKLALYGLHSRGAQLSLRDVRVLEQYSKAVAEVEAKGWLRQYQGNNDNPY